MEYGRDSRYRRQWRTNLCYNTQQFVGSHQQPLGDFEIEGDYILHWDNEYEDYQLNWEKQNTHRYEKKENGVLYHHKSLFVPNHGTGWCLMYPLSILPLLKEVSCTPTMADIEIYGVERASYCHRITNYSEIPEWIEANQELGYFKAS